MGQRPKSSTWNRSGHLWKDGASKWLEIIRVIFFRIWSNSTTLKVMRTAPRGSISTFDQPLNAPGSELFSIVWISAVQHIWERLKRFLWKSELRWSTKSLVKVVPKVYWWWHYQQEIFLVRNTWHYSAKMFAGNEIEWEFDLSTKWTDKIVTAAHQVQTRCFLNIPGLGLVVVNYESWLVRMLVNVPAVKLPKTFHVQPFNWQIG